MYKDSYNREWPCGATELDKYCYLNDLILDIAYKPYRKPGKCPTTHVFTKVYFKTTRETIIDRIDRYPPSDDEVLLEVKKYFRNKKINLILNDTKL